MKRKLFMFFAVVCVVAALVTAPIVTWAAPTVASDIGTVGFVALVGTLALLVIAAVVYRFNLKRFLYFALAVGRQLRSGARDHAPISMWRIFAVTVLAIAGMLTFASAFGTVALTPPTVLVALAMLTLVCAAADTVCRLWRVRDHAPMSVGRFSKITTVLTIVVVGFIVLTTASPPAVLMNILAFLIVIALAITVFAYTRIRGHTLVTGLHEAAHDAKNARRTDTLASMRKRATGLEVRSHPTLALSGAPG